jgi:hypothetical protein
VLLWEAIGRLCRLAPFLELARRTSTWTSPYGIFLATPSRAGRGRVDRYRVPDQVAHGLAKMRGAADTWRCWWRRIAPLAPADVARSARVDNTPGCTRSLRRPGAATDRRCVQTPEGRSLYLRDRRGSHTAFDTGWARRPRFEIEHTPENVQPLDSLPKLAAAAAPLGAGGAKGYQAMRNSANDLALHARRLCDWLGTNCARDVDLAADGPSLSGRQSRALQPFPGIGPPDERWRSP